MDAISKKALIDRIENGANYLYEKGHIGVVGVLVNLRDEIESGRFDITSPAEGRYREALEKIADIFRSEETNSNTAWMKISHILVEDLSPIGEQKEDTE